MPVNISAHLFITVRININDKKRFVPYYAVVAGRKQFATVRLTELQPSNRRASEKILKIKNKKKNQTYQCGLYTQVSFSSVS